MLSAKLLDMMHEYGIMIGDRRLVHSCELAATGDDVADHWVRDYLLAVHFYVYDADTCERLRATPTDGLILASLESEQAGIVCARPVGDVLSLVTPEEVPYFALADIVRVYVTR